MSAKPLQLGRAVNLVMRTLPIAGVRLGVLLLFWLATVAYVAAIAGITYFLGRVAGWAGIVSGVVGVIGYVVLLTLARRYVLYVVKAAQIAVMARLLVAERLPGGVSQYQWGKEQVISRFGEVNAMFVVDQIVTVVVRGFSSLVYGLVSWLPGNTFRGLATVVGRIVHYAVTYVDEAILARAFWEDTEGVWNNARDGVVLYAMVWKPLLINALVLMVLSYVPGVVVVLLLAAPIGALAGGISPELANWGILIALALGFVIKAAIGDSFAMAATIATYQQATQGLEPDPALLARLGQVPRFDDLSRRAGEEGATRRLDPAAAPIR